MVVKLVLAAIVLFAIGVIVGATLELSAGLAYTPWPQT